MLVLALFALLGSYALAQATSRDSARRILENTLPEITDFDHAFTAHYDELRSAASSPSAGGVSLPGYPIKVTVSAHDVTNDTPTALRQLLLQRTADAVYDRGIDAFSPDGKPVKLGSSGIFSAPWAFRTALRVVSPTINHRMQQVAKLSAVAALLFGALLLVLARAYNRTVLYGMALLIAALPGLAVAALAWLLVQVLAGGSSDPLIGGTADIARDVSWFLVISYLIYAGIAIAITALGLLVERIADAVGRPPDPATSADYRVAAHSQTRSAIDRSQPVD